MRLTTTVSSTCRVKLERGERGKDRFRVDTPSCAKHYDETFSGVDRFGQLQAKAYSLCLTFRAMKWTTKLFFGMVDMALANAWILWREIHPRWHKDHAKWWEQLAEELLVFNPDSDPVYEWKRQPGEVDPGHGSCKTRYANPTTRRRVFGNCPMCSTGTPGNRKRKRVSRGCVSCRVALHPGVCHDRWHLLSKTKQAKLQVRCRLKRSDFLVEDPAHPECKA